MRCLQVRRGNFDFRQLVFSGGGIRCFWHGGFLETAGPALDLRPERIAAVSGGALSMAAWLGGRETCLLEAMVEAFIANESNVSVDGPTLTPHEAMYRRVVERTVDARTVEAVAEGPDCEVLLGVPPQWVPPHLYVMLAGMLYQADRAVRSCPHLAWPRRVGLRPLRVSANKAARDGTLVDLICAAATIPPVFDVPCWRGIRVVDGGMIDKAPPPRPDDGRTLFLLTTRYRNCPEEPHRVYAAPTAPVPADKIDFADPRKVLDTWELGMADGHDWLARQRVAGYAPQR